MVGFGEAAKAFVGGWRGDPSVESAPQLSCYDIKWDDAGQRPQLLQSAADLEVACAPDLRAVLAGKNTIFSLVTADQALTAATNVSGTALAGAWFFDCNSCAPSTKAKSAKLIGDAGGRYVDVAVMAPVYPKQHRTPLLVAGPDVEEALPIFAALGMDTRLAGTSVGQASSIKMLRSVMIKGLEALTAECMLAPRRAGVEEAVLASLQASDPGFDWASRSAYNLERMMVHGGRRASEMEEVAATLRDLGLPDRMASATVQWQREVAKLDLPAGDADLGSRADRILDGFGK